MPSANVTITGKTGPAFTLTSKVFTGARQVLCLVDQSIIRIVQLDGTITDFDYTGMATVTYTISGAVASVAFS